MQKCYDVYSFCCISIYLTIIPWDNDSSAVAVTKFIAKIKLHTQMPWHFFTYKCQRLIRTVVFCKWWSVHTGRFVLRLFIKIRFISFSVAQSFHLLFRTTTFLHVNYLNLNSVLQLGKKVHGCVFQNNKIVHNAYILSSCWPHSL